MRASRGGSEGSESGAGVSLRDLMDIEVTDAMWGEIIRRLAELAASGEKDSIQAAKLLLAYRHGTPTKWTEHEQAPPIHIRTIEARLSERTPTRENRKRGRRVGAAAAPAPGSVESVEVET